jgi:general secretion pathway protein K
MLSEFQDDTAASLSSALTERDLLKAEYAAKSAINLSRLVIASEPTIRSAIAPMFMLMNQKPPQLPVWEFANDLVGMFNGPDESNMMSTLARIDLAHSKNFGLDGARFEVVVVDEDSKININTAARGDSFSRERIGAAILGLIGGPQYNELFEREDSEGQISSRQDVCAALVDWADPDVDMYLCDPFSAVAQSAPPEDSFYQLLDPPYPRKNAAFDSLDELHMVRGMTEDFWATFVEPDPDNPASRPITVWGQGAVNINTANPQTLLGIVCSQAVEAPICIDPEKQMQFLSLLELVKGFTQGLPVFTSGKQLVDMLGGKGPMGEMLMSMAQMQPIQLRNPDEINKMVSAESKIFSIIATGKVSAARRETQLKIHAVVDFRGAPDVPAAPSVDPNDPTAPVPEETPPANLPNGATEDALARAFRADPAGKVIHYRFY